MIREYGWNTCVASLMSDTVSMFSFCIICARIHLFIIVIYAVRLNFNKTILSSNRFSSARIQLFNMLLMHSRNALYYCVGVFFYEKFNLLRPPQKPIRSIGPGIVMDAIRIASKVQGQRIKNIL